MDFEQIKEIINLVSSKGYTKMNMDIDNFHLSISKNIPVITNANIKNAFEEDRLDKKTIQTNVDEPITILPEDKPVILEGNVVYSPLVGTFYSSAGENKPTFVTIGSKVKKGDVICIIEAMKVMNEIISEFNGTVEEIFVSNDDMVEYNQPIFRIV